MNTNSSGESVMERTPVDVARALYAALESGAHGESLRDLFTADARTITHPNLIAPAGGVSSLERILQGSEQGAKLLARQTWDVKSAFAHEGTAVVRILWTGVVARATGPFREGQVITAHVAQFVEVRDGRIASIETFDCYEPLA